MDFELIKVPNGFHLFNKSDLCTYAKNGSESCANGDQIQYYKCTTITCRVRGKVFQGKFIFTSKNTKHNHANHKHKVAAQIAYEEIKEKVGESSRIPSRKVYIDVMKS